MDRPDGEGGEHRGGELDLDVQLAHAATLIDAGEYSHGVRHLGYAAAVDPSHPAVEALLERVAENFGELAPDTVEPAQADELWSGEAAVRAWLLRRSGRVPEGVTLLLEVIGADPERRWWEWLLRWIDEDPALPLAADTVIAMCGALVQPILHTDPTPAVRATLAAAAMVVEATMAGDPDNGWLRSIGSGVARRAGREADAVRWASEGDRLTGSMISACMLGYAYRAAGDNRRAFDAFATASERDGSDPDPRLDAADSLAAAGAWHDAAEWAESAWALDRDRGAAAARTLCFRYRDTGDPATVLQLLEWLESRLDDQATLPPTVGDAPALATTAGATLPWVAHLPIPGNAAVNGARQLHALPDRASGGGKLTLTGPDAPTALLVLGLTVAGPLDVTIERVPAPDPRLPRRPVATLAWRLDGTVLVPGVPEPSAAALRAMKITRTPWYRLVTARRDAAAVVRCGVTPADLVSLAVHPMPGPRAVPPWEWVRQWQLVCCLGLAALDAVDVLCDLADGPEDWLCDAALAGLVDLAERRRDLRLRILQFATAHLLESSRRLATLDLPHFGSECDLFLLLPGRPEVDAAGARELKQAWLRRYEQAIAPPSPAEPGAERAGAGGGRSGAREA